MWGGPGRGKKARRGAPSNGSACKSGRLDLRAGTRQASPRRARQSAVVAVLRIVTCDVDYAPHRAFFPRPPNTRQPPHAWRSRLGWPNLGVAVRSSFEISSVLAADVDAVWAHCSSMKGVSRELWPWVRMTYPDDRDSLVTEPFVPGQRLFRSTLLLFGIVPIDRTDLSLMELQPGRRFLERSPMATQRIWQHERLLEPVPAGTRITDRLQWRGRFPGASTTFAVAVPFLFKWRHRRLKRLLGT